MKEDGYTIIEILVSLTLLGILLMFTTNIFTLVTSRQLTDTKINAIEEAKIQLNKTVHQELYEDIDKKLDRNLHLVQKTFIQDSLIIIKLRIIKESNNKIIYEVKTIVPRERR